MAWAWAATLVVSGCGGGGGGSSATPVDTAGAGPATAGAVSGTGAGSAALPGNPETKVLVEGIVTFESVPTRADGGLNYAAQTRKPARLVAVDALDPGTAKVLASGKTDATGHFALSLPARTATKLRISAQLYQDTGASTKPSVQVADNTNGAYVYAVSTDAFVTGTGRQQFDVNIPSGWLASSADGVRTPGKNRAAAPFAILDTIYASQAKVLQAAPATVLPELIVLWSEKNTPAVPVNISAGEIGDSQFVVVLGRPVMLLLGKEGVDTDEYDASVITHEWGHYFQKMFGRNDSEGGQHVTGDRLDRNVAFAEGWATAWSGIALDSARYTDSKGNSGAPNIVHDLATAPEGNRGWFNEDSLQYVLRKLHESAGLGAVIDAFRGPFRTAVASTGIHSFHASLFKVAPKAAASWAGVLESQAISPAQDDAWGTRETNSGGSSHALPMYGQLAVGTPSQEVCVSNEFDVNREGNKLGEVNYLKFTVTEARAYAVRVTATGTAATASDPDFSISGTSGTLMRSVARAPASEAASVTLAAGDYLIAVRDYEQSSANTCFTVSIQ